MNFIVLDLEWNQCPYGKTYEDKNLPFEIIEIGAVRTDESRKILDRFSEVVKPQIYTSLDFHTSEVVSLRSIDFKDARFFPEVFSDFWKWCGDDPVFCTWGPSDLIELQRNLTYHHIENPFAFPLFYYDIQKIFSIVFEDRKTRRSLKHVVDYLELPEEIPFHDALSDAIYTAEIMKYLTNEQVLANSSIDYFRTPQNRCEEIYVKYRTYSKFVSQPYDSKLLAMKDKHVTATVCPECQKASPKKLHWFSHGSRNYYCISWCEEHGYLKGKIRLRQRSDGRYYAVRTIKPVSFEEVLLVKERKGPKSTKHT